MQDFIARFRLHITLFPSQNARAFCACIDPFFLEKVFSQIGAPNWVSVKFSWRAQDLGNPMVFAFLGASVFSVAKDKGWRQFRLAFVLQARTHCYTPVGAFFILIFFENGRRTPQKNATSMATLFMEFTPEQRSHPGQPILCASTLTRRKLI